jgi:ribosomal protein L30E
LKKATSQKDVEKNLKIIQKAFKDSLGFDASIESLEKYKDKFIEWANAGEEASDDIAT